MSWLPSLPDVATWSEVVDELRRLADETAKTIDMMAAAAETYPTGMAYLVEVRRGLVAAADMIERRGDGSMLGLLSGPRPSRSQSMTVARRDGHRTWRAIVDELSRKVLLRAN